jgi:toxin ParE1/3/4
MPDRYGIEWAPSARGDLDTILEYIATRDCVEAAGEVHDKLLHRIESLATYPARCRIPPELKEVGIVEFRELIMAPYSVFFRIRQGTVGIVGIWDRRRNLQDLLLERVLRV